MALYLSIFLHPGVKNIFIFLALYLSFFPHPGVKTLHIFSPAIVSIYLSSPWGKKKKIHNFSPGIVSIFPFSPEELKRSFRTLAKVQVPSVLLDLMICGVLDYVLTHNTIQIP